MAVVASTLVAPLDGSARETDLVGSKAALLDRLVAAGFRVPRSLVLTIEAYELFVANPTVAALLAELSRDTLPRPVDFAGAAAAVDRAFLDAAMPAPVLAAIRGLGRDIGLPARTVAVRSSATAEDLVSASFAGQYRTLLDVADNDALERAVRLIWASLWHPGPRTYRRFRDIDESSVAMAVLVMPMVDAEIAGVSFSVDPGGAAGAMRIEVVEGRGDTLVSGRVTPVAYVIDRDVAPSLPTGSHPALADVARVTLDIERSLGCGQDVEWAYDGSTLHILQARPITTIVEHQDETNDGFDSVISTTTRYTTAGIAEMLPGALPPLVWTINKRLIEEAFRTLFSDLGALPPDLADGVDLIVRARSRAVLDLDVFGAILELLSGTSEEEIEHQFFGAERGTAASQNGRRRWRNVLHDVRSSAVRRRALSESAVVCAAAHDVVTMSPDPTTLGTDELLTFRHRLIDLAGRIAAAEVAVASAATAAYQRLEATLTTTFGPRSAATRAQALTSGAIGARAGFVASELAKLAQTLSDAPDLAAEIAGTTDWSEAELSLAGTEVGLLVLDRLGALLRTAGSASVFAGATWEESPALIWQTLRRLIGYPAPPGAAATTPLTSARPHAAVPRPQPRGIFEGMVRNLRRRVAALHRLDAVDYLRRRELTKEAFLQVGGQVRRIHLEIGRRAVESGQLECPEDIDFVSDAELPGLAAGEGPGLATVARRRRRFAAAVVRGPLPNMFVGRPPEATLPRATGTILRGWGASPGVFQGRARVLATPVAASIDRGDVLVARSTDASWSPLFLIAGAIVVEEGGPLSHAAIVARELGLPAVLNVPGAIDRLASDEPIVTVDGTEGSVAIESDRPSAVGAPAGMGRNPAAPAPAVAATGSTFVFVPSILGAGALVTIALVVREQLRKLRSLPVMQRRARLTGHMAALGVVGGDDVAARDGARLHRRAVYVVVAATSVSLALYSLIGATLNFLRPWSYVHRIAWLWALFLAATATFLLIATVSAVLAVRGARRPVWANPFLTESPLGCTGAEEETR